MAEKNDLSQLKRFLGTNRGKKLRYDNYITCHRAVLWICYGVFADARSRANSLERTLSIWADRGREYQADEHELGENYDLAFEQLLTAVRKNRIHLLAKYWIPSASDLVLPTYVPPAEQYQIISGDDLSESEIIDTGDGQYYFGEHTIELLLVPFGELELVFGSLVRKFVKAADSMPRLTEPAAKMGRPPKWDWEWLYIQIILLANQSDGLYEQQADLERWCEERFIGKYGAAPDESHIRKKIALIYQTISR